MQIRKIVSPDAGTVEIITKWMYSWWGERENYSFDAVKEYISHSFNESTLPITFGLYDEDELIGMYQITYSDLFVRPDIYPWLANVFIPEKYRNKGLGKLLIGSVTDNLNVMPFDEIYLYTTHEGLYEKYGWEFIGMIRTFLPENDLQRLYRLKKQH